MLVDVTLVIIVGVAVHIELSDALTKNIIGEDKFGF